MTGHAKETTKLWDSSNPAIQALHDIYGVVPPKTDNKEPTPKNVSDPHELSELCPKCEEGFIGPDGICVVCWYLS